MVGAVRPFQGTHCAVPSQAAPHASRSKRPEGMRAAPWLRHGRSVADIGAALRWDLRMSAMWSHAARWSLRRAPRTSLRPRSSSSASWTRLPKCRTTWCAAGNVGSCGQLGCRAMGCAWATGQFIQLWLGDTTLTLRACACRPQDTIPMNHETEDDTCLSALESVRQNSAHCIEGAMLGVSYCSHSLSSC